MQLCDKYGKTTEDAFKGYIPMLLSLSLFLNSGMISSQIIVKNILIAATKNTN